MKKIVLKDKTLLNYFLKKVEFDSYEVFLSEG